MRRALAAALALALVAGCRQDPTEIVLVVDTDLTAPAELDTVHIVVSGSTGASVYDQAIAVGSGAPHMLPLSLTLEHQSGAPLGPVKIAATAQRASATVVEVDVTTEFVQGRTKLLRVVLARACAGRSCGMDMTCVETGCIAQHRPGTSLPDFVSLPPRYDGGVLGDGCRPEVCNGLDDDCDGVVDNGFDLVSETGNCGMCGNDCATKPGVATAHCAAGACVVDTCTSGHGDCGGGGADGCETDTTSDAAHCGMCTTPCSTVHATPTCAASACSLSCAPGFDDCDTMVSTGCEADLTGMANCGRCFHRCTIACSGGYCDDDVVVQIATGGQHACALRRSGVVSCWGENGNGQLGDGTTTRRSAPVDAVGITNAIAIAAGGQHTCAVLADHTVACWGDGTAGRLGRGSTTSSSTPVAVTGVSDAVAIAAGLGHTCVVRMGGLMKCWGLGGSGQIGNGVMGNALTPADVTGFSDAAGVACGQSHTCAVRTGGGVKCWGANDHGQLGTRSPFLLQSSTPVDIPMVSGEVAVAGSPGANHVCALDGAGAMTCWGQDLKNELGDGLMTDRGTDGSTVTLPRTASAIGIGATYSCAVLADGTAQCWGANDHGQLGDGTTLPHAMPAAVSGAASYVELAGGNGHTCARAMSGAVSCWGWNSSGQLGDGTMTDRPTPGGVRTLPF